jgi:hypothetical protein
MITAETLVRQRRYDAAWHKYCGFLDLRLSEFMDIQESLLLEQIERLQRCELGRQLLGGRPRTVEEFRKTVPLTTYRDYLPFLTSRSEEVLPAKPCVWARTSGRSAEYDCKWAPYSREMLNKVGEFAIGAFMLASCAGRGDVWLETDDVCLYTLAPAPYFTGGIVAPGLLAQFPMTFIPSLEEGAQMEFGERIRAGFRLAMEKGIDWFYGLSSVLVAIAEQFERGGGGAGFSHEMLRPRALGRIAAGFARSKLKGRPLLPSDLWRVKGIVAGGMDTAFFSDKIERYWGKRPLEGYGGTELGGVALQAWNFRGLSFLPDSSFLEFIPEADVFGNGKGPDPQPATRQLDELTPGVYELVISNFHGGVFTRYRTGDLLEIVAMRDDELSIDIPQMVFHARADGVIDIAGFTRLTEKAVWQAIQEAGVPYAGWTMRKEYSRGKPVLALYVEPSDGVTDPGDIRSMVNQELRQKDAGYAELEGMLGLDPLIVKMLPKGAFERYMEAQRAAGADLAHIKPPQVNAPENVVQQLVAR